VVKVVRAEIPAEKALLLARTDPALAAANFAVIQAGANEVALVFFDDDPKHLVLPNTTRVFWKTLTKVDVEKIDTATDMRISKAHMDKIDLSRTSIAVTAVVEPHEAALLIVDGALKEQLGPGRYGFWQVGRAVRLQKVDLRPQPLEVTAQEILTKDRVSIRVTLTAFYRVTDAVLAATSTADLATRSTGWCSSPSARRWRRAPSTTSSRPATPSTRRCVALSRGGRRRSGRRSARSG
jgi:hypothetical protein